MPVGFKNRTDGNVQVAVDAVRAAAGPHAFAGIDPKRHGRRSSTRAATPTATSSFAAAKAAPTTTRRASRRRSSCCGAAGLPERVMIDLSHDNSGKDPERQPGVAAEVGAADRGRQRCDRRRDAGVVPRRRPPGSRAGRRAASTASRSPTAASPGRRRSRCWRGWRRQSATATPPGRRARHAERMRIAVLGVGLIGGSIGLAARARAGAEVSGYDPDPGGCERALELGAIDRAAGSVAEAVADAEAVFVAAPVGALPAAVAEALAAAPADCVVSDVGSTKRMLAAAADDPRFVGGHPLAGAETDGRRARARGPLRRRHLVPDADAREHGRRPVRAPARAAAPARRAPGGDRRGDARPADGVRLAPAARAREPARRAGGGHARGARRGRRAAARRRAELPRRDPGRRRQQRDLDRHLPLQRRRARRRDRRARVAGSARCARCCAARDAGALAAWNEGARADRDALLGARHGGRLGARAARARCRTARASSPRSRWRSARPASTSATWCSRPRPTTAEGVIALWIGGEEPAGARRGRSCAVSASRSCEHEAAAHEHALRPGPRRCAGSSRRRPTSRSPIAPALLGAMSSEPVRDRELPRRRRHALDARRPSRALGALVERARRRDRDPGHRAARGARAGRADRRRQRRHAAAAAARLARGAARAARSRSTATTRSAAAPSTASRCRCARWARTSRRRDGRFPPLTVHGARPARRSTTTSTWRARRSSRACCSPRLTADGATTVAEPSRSRDHTERMLLRAGRRDRPRGQRA